MMGKVLSKRKVSRNNRTLQTERKSANNLTGQDGIMTPPTIHTDAVVCLASVQPGLCISGSKDKSVVLYDYHNNRLEDRWTGHDREVSKVCYGASCFGIFSASRDKTVKMWRRGNSHSLQDFVGHEMVVTAVHLNHDNTLLCSGSRDNTVRIWDIESGKCLQLSNIAQNLVTDVKWLPGSQQVLQTGEDKEVRIFDTRNMSVVRSFPKKRYIQMSCDVTPDGRFCITSSNGFGGNGCEVTLWNLKSFCIVHEFRGHQETVEACIFLPESSSSEPQRIATASRDCSVRVWNRDTRDCIYDTNISASGPLTSLVAYENGSLLVGTFNTGVHVLELRGNSLEETSFY